MKKIISGKVYDNIGMFFFEEFVNCFTVTDIGFHKAELWVIHDGFQCRQITGIGELIKAYDAVIRMSFQHMKDKV